MKTGMQLTNADAGLRAPARRTTWWRSRSRRAGRRRARRRACPCRTWTTSAVEPGAFSMTCDRYLPMPSWVMPRWTLTPRLGTSRELDGVVLAGEDRLGEVLADLVRVDVERGDELDVADVVAAEVDVHQAGDVRVRVGVSVVLDALDEGGGAVADADDGDAHLVGRAGTPVLRAIRGHGSSCAGRVYGSCLSTWRARWATVIALRSASSIIR